MFFSLNASFLQFERIVNLDRNMEATTVAPDFAFYFSTSFSEFNVGYAGACRKDATLQEGVKCSEEVAMQGITALQEVGKLVAPVFSSPVVQVVLVVAAAALV